MAKANLDRQLQSNGSFVPIYVKENSDDEEHLVKPSLIKRLLKCKIESGVDQNRQHKSFESKSDNSHLNGTISNVDSLKSKQQKADKSKCKKMDSKISSQLNMSSESKPILDDSNYELSSFDHYIDSVISKQQTPKKLDLKRFAISEPSAKNLSERNNTEKKVSKCSTVEIPKKAPDLIQKPIECKRQTDLVVEEKLSSMNKFRGSLKRKLAIKDNSNQKYKYKNSAAEIKSNSLLPSSNGSPVPLFIQKCVKFIEKEGLNTKGLYRVSGNKSEADKLFALFCKNPNINLHLANFSVIVVTTALKSYFYKHLPPIFSTDCLKEIVDLSKQKQMNKIKKFLFNLPYCHYRILHFIISHFVKVVERKGVNQMKSENLAICWWPTLLKFDFKDMAILQQMEPHLKNFVKLLIDNHLDLFNENNKL